jgi:hypothetical protein
LRSSSRPQRQVQRNSSKGRIGGRDICGSLSKQNQQVQGYSSWQPRSRSSRSRGSTCPGDRASQPRHRSSCHYTSMPTRPRQLPVPERWHLAGAIAIPGAQEQPRRQRHLCTAQLTAALTGAQNADTPPRLLEMLRRYGAQPLPAPRPAPHRSSCPPSPIQAAAGGARSATV